MANCSLLVRLSALCFFVLASAFTLPHPVTRRGATTCSASEGSSSTTGKELKKFASIAISAAALLLAQPAPSDASYGSGGAAVFSFPQVKSLSVDEFLKLPDAKKKQRQFTISCSADDKACQRNVDRLLQEFKLNIKDIKAEQQKEAQLDQMASEVSQRVSQKQKELDQSLGLEVQLQERSDMLNKLAAQPAWVSYGAAAAGSVVSTLIMHPLDTLKIRLITKKDKEGEEEEPIDIKSLYKGIGANIAKEAPASAFYLGVYEIVRGYLSTTFLAQSDPLIIYLLAGAIGELFGSIVRAPTEAVKTRVQAFGSMTTREAIDSAFSEKGREGMLRSWAVSLWRDVPMGAIQLALFEGLKAYVISAPGIDFDVSTLSAEALFGAIGGAVGALVTTPFDIITVLTISSLEGESNKYTGMGGIEIAKDILATKGPKGLFQGSFERTVYWAPAIGIFLSVYCSTRQMGI